MLDGEVFNKHEIYIFERIECGIFFIDDIEANDSYEEEIVYNVCDSDGVFKGYMHKLDFEEYFEVLDIGEIDKIFNKIMDGDISG
jgi:hypothetical protein